MAPPAISLIALMQLQVLSGEWVSFGHRLRRSLPPSLWVPSPHLACKYALCGLSVRVLRGTVSNGYMTLDRLMFDSARFPPFTVTVGCVRSKASVFPRILDDIVTNLVAKGKIFEFIELGGTKNGTVLSESC